MSLPFEEARAIDAREILDRLGVPRTRRKTHYRCPVCEGKALMVYTDGRATCHGCKPDESMNAIDLVMHVTGLDAEEACRQIASWYGLEEGDGRRLYMAPRREVREERRREAHTTPVQVYRDLFARCSTSEALPYLKGRGFEESTIARARVRAVTREAWESVLRDTPEPLLIQAGLVRKKDDGTTSPLLFAFPVLLLPYHDPEGELSQVRFGVYGEARKIDQHRKYLSCFDTKQAHLWGVEQADMRGELHITEGELNALALRQIGLQALACSGSGTWDDAWCSSLADCTRLVLWQDEDRGGDMWATAILDSLSLMLGDDFTTERVQIMRLPTKKDANDLLQSGILHHTWRHGDWRCALAVPVCEIASIFARYFRGHDEHHPPDQETLRAHAMTHCPAWYEARMRDLFEHDGDFWLCAAFCDDIKEVEVEEVTHSLHGLDRYGRILRVLELCGGFTPEEME